MVNMANSLVFMVVALALTDLSPNQHNHGVNIVDEHF